MHRSFLRYAGGRYLWLALLLCGAAVASYLSFDPGEPPNGGTLVGYALGTAAALLVVWLSWYGVRKRAFHSRQGKVQGWLSAHVYLGLALLVLATLHTGFQFGANIHTLAYGLMVGVILSGLFGVIAYRRYPALITANRGSQDRDMLLREISLIDQRCRDLADRLGDPVSGMVASAIDRFRIGGGVLMQLRAHDASSLLEPDGNAPHHHWRRVANPRQQRLLEVLADRLSHSTDAAQVELLKALIEQTAAKRRLVRRLLSDIRMQGMMEIWLYFHVPLTLALLGALAAHVFSVFFYW